MSTIKLPKKKLDRKNNKKINKKLLNKDIEFKNKETIGSDLNKLQTNP